MVADASPSSLRRDLRAALVIGLAGALGYATCEGLGLSGESLAYGALIAVLVVRPDFSRWPPAIYPVLLILMGVCLGIGTSAALLLSPMPQVLLIALVAALMQLLSLLLPSSLRLLSPVVAVAGVLPVLGTPSWTAWRDQVLAIAVGLAVGTVVQLLFTPSSAQAGSESPEPASKTSEHPSQLPSELSVGARLRHGLHSPFFWRKLIMASLAYPIGLGLGAVNPKYLYFGVVLLLNDSIGATLARVRDRMAGVSLGVLMPLLVFNTLGISELSIGIVMTGTAALVIALNRQAYLRTALISSGVAFIGYGPLVAWYIPNRWIDYLMGCGLALAVGVLLFPQSALRRFNQLSSDSASASQADLLALLPAAREEARWLGLPTPELPMQP
jgi:uncharacterized membrane protein YgaE (UPF0421/DUF939 family)